MSGWGFDGPGGPQIGVSCWVGLAAVGGGTVCTGGWLRRWPPEVEGGGDAGSAGSLEAAEPVWEPRWIRWLTMMLFPKPPMDAMVVLCSRCTTAVIPPSAMRRRIRARASSPELNSDDSAGDRKQSDPFRLVSQRSAASGRLTSALMGATFSATVVLLEEQYLHRLRGRCPLLKLQSGCCSGTLPVDRRLPDWWTEPQEEDLRRHTSWFKGHRHKQEVGQ